MAISGFSIGIEIQEALGLPQETTHIEIYIGLDKPVEVVCAASPNAEGMAKVLAILKRYNLVEKEGPPVSDAHAAARQRETDAQGRRARVRRLREQLRAEQRVSEEPHAL